MMMGNIKLYLLTFFIFLIIDALWLGWIAKDLYKAQIGHLMGDHVRWGPALVFYLLYIFGLVFFAVSPGLLAHNWKITLFNGALFGLMCYATYDLTNFATLKGWPLKIVIYDLVWGTFISALTAILSFMIVTHWKRIFE